MFLTYFQPIFQAMLQIFLLGALGFFLIRKDVISEEGLNGLTRLLVEIVFPALIFWQVVVKFDFRAYPRWWVLSGASLLIIGLGFILSAVLGRLFKDKELRKEFMSLVAFQNSGYLPLALLGLLTPKEQLGDMLINLFLFLLGFNLLIWSLGVHMLSQRKTGAFSMGSVFSPPVIAILAGFAFVITGLNKVIPDFVLKPVELLGGCSFPLAIIVVGASLADLHTGKKLKIKPVTLLVVTKLLLMPALGIALLYYFRVPRLMGFLLILQMSMPSATTLAIIARRYRKEENMVSQGIFITHLASLATIPLFLSLYNWVVSNF